MSDTTIFDPVRKRHVALTPEEWVRQQLIRYLHEGLGYPLEMMQVEGAISVGGLTRRCDVVVYGGDMRPRMIVECKRPQVPISQSTVDQACRYNLTLHVPLLLLANGRQMVCLLVSDQEPRLRRLEAVPAWEQLRVWDVKLGGK